MAQSTPPAARLVIGVLALLRCRGARARAPAAHARARRGPPRAPIAALAHVAPHGLVGVYEVSRSTARRQPVLRRRPAALAASARLVNRSAEAARGRAAGRACLGSARLGAVPLAAAAAGARVPRDRRRAARARARARGRGRPGVDRAVRAARFDSGRPRRSRGRRRRALRPHVRRRAARRTRRGACSRRARRERGARRGHPRPARRSTRCASARRRARPPPGGGRGGGRHRSRSRSLARGRSSRSSRRSPCQCRRASTR